jgi:DTW domain-containing protein YfiP
MNLEAYRRRKAELAAQAAVPSRPRCYRCRKPALTCYCASVRRVEAPMEVLILMHPLEARHPVGTGRMAHQCLPGSRLILGTHFDGDTRLAKVLADDSLHPLVLFPGPTAHDLSRLQPAARQALVPAGKRPLLIVIDGTWHCARKLLHRSPDLQRLPRICFTPSRASGFVVRRQPKALCFSTIEAIHEVLGLFDPAPAGPRSYDGLLAAFDEMVQHQLSFRVKGPSRHYYNYQARKAREAAAAAPQFSDLR